MSFALPLADALTHVGRPDLAKTAADDALAFHSKDSTFVTYVQSVLKNASAEVLGLCEDHARFWGIGEQCKTAAAKLEAYQPESVADQAFALVAEFAGTSVRKYAAYDKQSVLESANAFYDDRAKYPLEWRKNASARLLGRAQTHEAILPDCVERFLQKSAGLGYPTPESLTNSLVQRVNLSPLTEDLSKLSAVFERMIVQPELRHDDEYVKSAMEVLAAFDTENGLVDYYGQGVSLPEEMIADDLTIQGMSKTASANRSCLLTNGRTVDVQGLSKDALAAIDPELTKLSHAELADVLPTLPKGDADLLSRLA